MRILLADQDRELMEFVKKGLTHEGIVGDIVCDGQITFEMASEGDHDAVLIETVMPNLSGYDVLKKLRTQGSDVPLLIVTSKSQEKDKLHGLNNGVDNYIVKPFLLTEVVARIRAVLRRTVKDGCKRSEASVLRAVKLELFTNWAVFLP